MRRTAVTAIVMIIAGGALALAAKFSSTWKAPDVDRLNFAGKKVAAAVISDDQNLQVSTEEALAAELSARGVNGVPAYRLIPREEMRDKEKAKGWIERSGSAGLVVMRVADVDRQVSYTPNLWVSTTYANPWDYYAYGWGTAIGGVKRREDTVIVIETLVFDVVKSKLCWAGASEKSNPKDAQKIVKELVAAVVAEMRKVGLVPKDAK